MGEYSAKVDAKLEDFTPEHAELAARLREMIHEQISEAAEDVKWGQPTFIVDGTKLFYLADAKDHIKFGLFFGADLPDPQGIVEGTGKKMRHVKIGGVDDLDEAAINELIRAAQESI
jgi:hypothetical protein